MTRRPKSTKATRPDFAQPREFHNDRLRRLVGETADRLKAEGLAPADAIYVCEGAAAKIRHEAEVAKLAKRGAGRE